MRFDQAVSLRKIARNHPVANRTSHQANCAGISITLNYLKRLARRTGRFPQLAHPGGGLKRSNLSLLGTRDSELDDRVRSAVPYR
jgi:hypothetical protein